MPGITGIITEQGIVSEINLLNTFHEENGVDYLKNSAKFQKAMFGRFSINKFQNDKVFKEINQHLICTEGIILNSKKLLNQYNANDLGELSIKLYEQYEWSFVEQFRGNFSGFLYSEKDNSLMVFTDHLAAKPIFYFHDKKSNTLIFASELKVVAKNMKQLGFTPQLDIDGAQCLLTFAYMLGDLTLVNEIKKLSPGNVLLYKNGEIELKEYYKLSSTPYIEGDENEIIKELDKRFKEAVRLEYEKDIEYGYSHIATLSGGLDSRTNVGYAKKIGINNITCFCFSESDYDDEKIAKKICRDNHLEFIFYALDNGNYLIKNISDIISANDGLVIYSGASHEYNCIRNFSFKEHGLIHTGQIGDLILGSYLQDKKHEEISDKTLFKSTYSLKLKDKIKKRNFEYENDEIFAFYERGVNGAFNGNKMIEQFTECASPFLYIEFLEYAMKIHPKYRYNQRIYYKWMNKEIHKFSKYKRDGIGLSPIDLLRYPPFILKLYKISRIIIQRAINIVIPKYKRHVNMNPFEYWWNTNSSLKNEFNSIFNEKIKVLNNYPELLEDCNYLFNEGSLINKSQVITLLKAIEILGLEGN